MVSAPPVSQPALDEAKLSLLQTRFCVVDLETTGVGDQAAITEIGAVLSTGGELLGEFATLVNPGCHIPAHISVLTGITNQMVADAPTIDQVLPSFLEFARGAVLVAHNAGFDIGFLQRACAARDTPWPGQQVLDTLRLARSVLVRGEVPNYKLGTLARLFRATTTPDHRALSDARATLDVLHGLFERIGNLGVTTLDEALDFCHHVAPERRSKRGWAKSLPHSCGVYWFWTQTASGARRRAPAEASDASPAPETVPADQEVLYVGKATDLRNRVGSYFSAAERRSRIDEMVRIADGLSHLPCATVLEAEVRELRMIASLQPRYNRRSRHQFNLLWLKLTTGQFPRLSFSRQLGKDPTRGFGPFRTREAAEQVYLTLQEAWPLRRCTAAASRLPPGCALADLGKCLAPCRTPDVDYAATVTSMYEALQLDVRPTVRKLGERISRLAAAERFEEAQDQLDRLTAYRKTMLRWQQLLALGRCAQLVAAKPKAGGWEIHVIRYGKLANAAFAPAGVAPKPVATAATCYAATVLPSPDQLPAGSLEEADRIAAWLDDEAVRLVDVQGEWSWPIHCGISDAEFRHLVGP